MWINSAGMDVLGEKRCTGCGSTKRLDEFPKCRREGNARRPRCKDCRRAEAAAYRATERGAQVQRTAKQRYRQSAQGRATESTYDRTYKAQPAVREKHRERDRKRLPPGRMTRLIIRVLMGFLRTKICTQCRTQKPLTDFYRQPAGVCGVMSKCRACFDERQHRWNQSEAGRASASRRIQVVSREDWRRRAQLHRARHPDHYLARMAVNRAIAKGRLTRPASCSRCGADGSRCDCKVEIHAHHHLGYAREHWLDVIWLCHRCHENEHHAAGTNG